MSEQIVAILKSKLADSEAYGKLAATTKVNLLKEELHYCVLNFIYHHPKHGSWIMYGGSAIRIIHGLDRMSVDLDFEIHHEAEINFLNVLKTEVEKHFSDVYGAGSDFLVVTVKKRGLILKFRVGSLIPGFSSEWVHVKIDLNYFIAPKTTTEHRPINRDRFSFVIVTYNMATLMASKIAAIFLREQRGVDKNIYDYKGRDIYDLLWYMSKKSVPDFDYLSAKHIDIRDSKALFNRLTIDILNYEKMDTLLKDDLQDLFENPFQFENWFNNWRESYLRFLGEYKINTVTSLGGIRIHEHFSTDNFSFTYTYNVEDGSVVRIRYILTYEWVYFSDVNLQIETDKNLEEKIEFTRDGSSSAPMPEQKLKQYATFFHQMTERYLAKINRTVLGDGIITKVIRSTAKNLNPKEEVLLNKSALLACELDDLLK